MTGEITARGVAARLVAGVIEDRAPLADQLQRGVCTALAPHDRARAQRLALATMRNLSRADAVLKPLMRR